MTKPILLTGGTGTLGRLVLPRLQATGQSIRVLSRNDQAPANGVTFVRGDLASGDGVQAAISGVGTVIHLAGSAKGDEDKAHQLVKAAQRAGVEHIVYISVVGADRIPIVSAVDRAMFGYFGSKLAAEEIIAGSGIPWTTLRATQFQEALLGVARQMTKMPVVPVPSGVRFQPVAADEVAERLVELALGEPSGLVPDLAGPKVYGMDELLRSYLHATNRRRLFIPMRSPGRASRAFREGANLAPERAVGRRTWEEFLAEELGAEQQNAIPGFS